MRGRRGFRHARRGHGYKMWPDAMSQPGVCKEQIDTSLGLLPCHGAHPFEDAIAFPPGSCDACLTTAAGGHHAVPLSAVFGHADGRI